MYKYLVFLFLLMICACSQKKNTTVEQSINNKPTLDAKILQHKPSLKINTYAQKKIENWKEYKELNVFLKRFESTSPNDALGNAIELKSLTKQLKDSINIKELETPAFKSRVNVLENEVLRLADMTKIPAITTNEVNVQVGKILSIFGSLNAKINAIYLQQKIDSDLDVNKFLTLDSTEINVSKKEKSIYEKRKKPSLLKPDRIR